MASSKLPSPKFWIASSKNEVGSESLTVSTFHRWPSLLRLLHLHRLLHLLRLLLNLLLRPSDLLHRLCVWLDRCVDRSCCGDGARYFSRWRRRIALYGKRVCAVRAQHDILLCFLSRLRNHLELPRVF